MKHQAFPCSYLCIYILICTTAPMAFSGSSENPVLRRPREITAEKVANSVEKAVVLAEKVATVIANSSIDAKKLIKFMENVAPLLGVIGPAVGVLSAILALTAEEKKSAELEAIEKLSARMDMRFDQLTRHIEQVANRLQNHANLGRYMDIRTNCEITVQDYQKYIKLPARDSELELKKTCGTHPPIAVLNWMNKNIVQDPFRMGILDTALGATKYNPLEFESMIKEFSSDAKKFATIWHACLNLTRSYSSLESAKHDAEIVDNISVSVNRRLDEALEELKKWPQRQLESDITDEIQNMDGKTHWEVAAAVYRKLSAKYTDAEFSVISHDPRPMTPTSLTHGFTYAHYYEGPNVKIVHRAGVRNVVVMWTNKTAPCTFEPGVSYTDRLDSAGHNLDTEVSTSEYWHGLTASALAGKVRAVVKDHGHEESIKFHVNSLFIYKWSEDESLFPHILENAISEDNDAADRYFATLSYYTDAQSTWSAYTYYFTVYATPACPPYPPPYQNRPPLIT